MTLRKTCADAVSIGVFSAARHSGSQSKRDDGVRLVGEQRRDGELRRAAEAVACRRRANADRAQAIARTARRAWSAAPPRDATVRATSGVRRRNTPGCSSISRRRSSSSCSAPAPCTSAQQRQRLAVRAEQDVRAVVDRGAVRIDAARASAQRARGFEDGDLAAGAASVTAAAKPA